MLTTMIAAKLAPDWTKRVLNVLVPFLLLVGLIAAISWYIQRIDHQREIAVKNLETMTVNFTAAKQAADTNAKTVETISDLREIDAEVMAKLVVINDNLAKSTAQTTAVRKELGAKNVAVKAYLDQPVPNDLRSLLNRQAAKYGSGSEVTTRVSTGQHVSGTTEAKIDKGGNY